MAAWRRSFMAAAVQPTSIRLSDEDFSLLDNLCAHTQLRQGDVLRLGLRCLGRIFEAQAAGHAFVLRKRDGSEDEIEVWW